MDEANENENLKVDEAFYKADLEVLSKYHEFSADLLKLSILGIGIFGVLLKTKTEILQFDEMRTYIIVSMIAFCISMAGSLAYRFFSTKGLNFHIKSIRKQSAFISKQRNLFYKMSVVLLVSSCISLAVGIISLVIGFAQGT